MAMVISKVQVSDPRHCGPLVMFLSLCLCVSVCQSVYFCVCVFVCLCICMFLCLSLSVDMHVFFLCVCLLICLCDCLSVCLFVKEKKIAYVNLTGNRPKWALSLGVCTFCLSKKNK